MHNQTLALSGTLPDVQRAAAASAGSADHVGAQFTRALGYFVLGTIGLGIGAIVGLIIAIMTGLIEFGC